MVVGRGFLGTKSTEWCWTQGLGSADARGARVGQGKSSWDLGVWNVVASFSFVS